MKAKALVLTTLLLPCLAIGCGQEHQPLQTATAPVSESRILSLYDKLELDMTKSQVEAILGEPIYSLRQQNGEEQCNCIKEPERTMESHESPMMFSGVLVEFKDDKLIKASYNPQWIKREHLLAYEQKKNSEQAEP